MLRTYDHWKLAPNLTTGIHKRLLVVDKPWKALPKILSKNYLYDRLLIIVFYQYPNPVYLLCEVIICKIDRSWIKVYMLNGIIIFHRYIARCLRNYLKNHCLVSTESNIKSVPAFYVK